MKGLIRKLLLLSALIPVIIYFVLSIYGDEITARLKTRLENEIMTVIGLTASIKDLDLSLSRGMTMYDVDILDKDTKVCTINEITLMPDIPHLLKAHRLKYLIHLTGFKKKDISCDLIFEVYSGEMPDLNSLYGQHFIESVYVIDGEFSYRDLKFSSICGRADLDTSGISNAKMHFIFAGTPYIAHYMPRPEEFSGFDISLRSKTLTLTGSMIPDNSDLILKEFNGVFAGILFTFDGVLKDIGTDTISGYGKAEAELDLTSIPELIGTFVSVPDNIPLSGKIRTIVDISGAGMSLTEYTVTAEISATGMSMGNIGIKDMYGKIDIREGRLTSQTLRASICKGELKAQIAVDLTDKDLPFSLLFDASGINYGTLISDLSPDEPGVSGRLEGTLDLQGYATSTPSLVGKGRLDIYDADLGTMPILTPFLGEIYAALQDTIPGFRKTIINRAYADLTIKNKRIFTNDLTLQGDTISIIAHGSVGFDGGLDLVFENKITGPSEEEEDWQTTLRNTIVNLGKMISRTHLRGTLKDPKWTIK
ncbi:MAG: AsmA-like C-terminal region-containing protein [Candidatus Omnitrophica bacterium]|nr:AsmA-like C-terminal region-containing protein [Candidatus Omnitrophota bacterium]